MSAIVGGQASAAYVLGDVLAESGERWLQLGDELLVPIEESVKRTSPLGRTFTAGSGRGAEMCGRFALVARRKSIHLFGVATDDTWCKSSNTWQRTPTDRTYSKLYTVGDVVKISYSDSTDTITWIGATALDVAITHYPDLRSRISLRSFDLRTAMVRP